VKGRDTITDLGLLWKVLVGVFLLDALICAAAGAYYALRAAYGWPEHIPIVLRFCCKSRYLKKLPDQDSNLD
jgi:hypothetical protein